MVLAAVQQSGRALEFASKVLRADWGVVRAAVLQEGNSSVLASEAPRADPRIEMEAWEPNFGGSEFAPMGPGVNPGVVLAAMELELELIQSHHGFCYRNNHRARCSLNSSPMRPQIGLPPPPSRASPHTLTNAAGFLLHFRGL
eukprot:CAMPEP_0172651062 /NCGR_PEP_ID=MMETSP1068-20121228/242607_1 /TAXON_ID=35684 /ORGANISM="Pseudopedinella elastica, Strain CCMP716" /LENGTH=142 /DNA_ID=CAMNT_0013465443 /DNA_START=826 /DNA_END=1254 /DNA_ORIENTATION=-